MSLKGKTVLVLGATGNCGAPVVEFFDKEGAIVYGTARSQEKFEAVRKEYGWSDAVTYVESDFSSDDAAADSAKKIMDATGGNLLYVINNIGFVTVGKSVLEASSEDILAITSEEFLPSHRASREFIKLLGDTEGATVTIVSGGLGHGLFPGVSKIFGGGFKNGMLINSVSCFNAAIVDDGLKVSVCGACIWFGVSRKGETENQFGFPSDVESGPVLGAAFAAMAIGKKAGQNVDMKTLEDAVEVGKEYKQDD
jgi:NAD(P)-dependent dehydrogenase (short-subunit alcohol dehydrogenase family)